MKTMTYEEIMDRLYDFAPYDSVLRMVADNWDNLSVWQVKKILGQIISLRDIDEKVK